MSFVDTWDFDPKDFETGGRSVMGEVKTRFAHYTLPGDAFKIRSVETAFTYVATGDELQQGTRAAHGRVEGRPAEAGA
jgi:hypothetical protein